MSLTSIGSTKWHTQIYLKQKSNVFVCVHSISIYPFRRWHRAPSNPFASLKISELFASMRFLLK